MRAAAQVESSEIPKHSPPKKLDTVKKLEEIALNVEVTPPKRAFAAGIVLMAYTSLRFSDVQKLSSLEVSEGSAHGALLQSGTKKPHGLPRHWARPRMGIAGSSRWVNPIIEFHDAHAKHNGTGPSFVFPRANRRWELERAEPAARDTARRKLALLCV